MNLYTCHFLHLVGIRSMQMKDRQTLIRKVVVGVELDAVHVFLCPVTWQNNSPLGSIKFFES